MLFFVFLILAGALAYVFISYSNKISTKQKQLSLLKKQNDELKQKINNLNLTAKDLTVEYITIQPSFTSISNNCKLYLAPIDNSVPIAKLEKYSYIKLLDSAKINNTLWYEISFESENRINNKGWIKAEFVNLEAK